MVGYFVFLAAVLLLPINWLLSLGVVIVWLAFYFFERKQDEQRSIQAKISEQKLKEATDRLLHDVEHIKETAENEFFWVSSFNPLAGDMQLVKSVAVPISKITRDYEQASSSFISPDRSGNPAYVTVVRGYDTKNRLVAVARAYDAELMNGVNDNGMPMTESVSKHQRIFLLQNGTSAAFQYAASSLLPKHILDPQFYYGDFIREEEKLINAYRAFNRGRQNPESPVSS